MADEAGTNAVELAAELTIAWLGNQNVDVSPDKVPEFLRNMYSTVSALTSSTTNGEAHELGSEGPAPAVSVKKSLASKDHIISMIDGKPYRTLKRHLSKHGLTPDEYRQRYNLRPDYPMVAESYSAARSAMAKKMGLGDLGRGARIAAKSARRPRRAR